MPVQPASKLVPILMMSTLSLLLTHSYIIQMKYVTRQSVQKVKKLVLPDSLFHNLFV